MRVAISVSRYTHRIYCLCGRRLTFTSGVTVVHCRCKRSWFKRTAKP